MTRVQHSLSTIILHWSDIVVSPTETASGL